MTHSTQKLIKLYNKTSKHSNYQLLYPGLAEIVHQENLSIKSRFEPERLVYLVKNVDFRGLSVADIGGNTGYFSFAALDHGAEHVDYFEGNPEHAQFVESAAEALPWADKVTVHSLYIDLAHEKLNTPTDIVFLLNVLHHVGDDYGSKDFNRLDALAHIAACLKNMARQARIMIFQLGFNWKGDKYLPLFDHGTKSEMIDFVQAACKEDWDVQKIGIAQRDAASIVYRDVNSKNIARDDKLGEFLNRPIFVLTSRLM